MLLGQLTLHVAGNPGQIAEIAALDEIPIPDFGAQPAAESAERLVPTLDAGVAKAKELLSDLDDARVMADWKIVKDGQVAMTMPRIAVLRTIMLNHWSHHRGQLSVYLRLLDAPAPSMYGPSADENPLA